MRRRSQALDLAGRRQQMTCSPPSPLSPLLAGIMSRILYGVTPIDPATYAAVTLLLCVLAAAASYLPARRAVRIDPIAVLREE